METAAVTDEYLHEPMDRRLWNESYYFDFTADDVRGFMRLGFQPFERRANVWFYLVQDGTVYWYRDETIPIENCHGHHVRTDALRKSYRIVDPHAEWSLTAEGTCAASDDSWDVLVGADESVPVELDLTFADPHHDAYSIDMLVDTQDHYDQTGHYSGTATIDGTQYEVDGQGFRDHSWGWFRDWTPGEWGHYSGMLQFENGECVTLVAQIRPDSSVRTTFGYRANGDRFETINEAGVSCSDGLNREDRGRAWAEGDRPERITYSPDFGEGRTDIHCTPLHNLPIGYEDRNWALSDPDGPWLQGVLNRMPVDCEWDGVAGSGWIEATHPFN
ncbi:DUF7065 domain-containing protein [Natronomonas amylolytica]|uniref:DUF7065 domain-containing protein n=1 Tax=Natronomonas amylolytica TaxID=3108498 RepID=UPI00300AA91E